MLYLILKFDDYLEFVIDGVGIGPKPYKKLQDCPPGNSLTGIGVVFN